MSEAKPHRKRDIFVERAIQPSFISDSISKHATRYDIGAHEIFLGQVRADVIDGRSVAAIEYTAYADMANEQITAIREEAFARWPQAFLRCRCAHCPPPLMRPRNPSTSLRATPRRP